MTSLKPPALTWFCWLCGLRRWALNGHSTRASAPLTLCKPAAASSFCSRPCRDAVVYASDAVTIAKNHTGLLGRSDRRRGPAGQYRVRGKSKFATSPPFSRPVGPFHFGTAIIRTRPQPLVSLDSSSRHTHSPCWSFQCARLFASRLLPRWRSRRQPALGGLLDISVGPSLASDAGHHCCDPHGKAADCHA